MFYLTMYWNHFIYGYMESEIWYRITQLAREETHCCHHMGYSFQSAPACRQDSTYHSLCYTSRVALAGTRNSSVSPP